MLAGAHAPRKHSARRSSSRTIDVTTDMMDQSSTSPARPFFHAAGGRRSSLDPLATANVGSLPSASSPARPPGATTSHPTNSSNLSSPSTSTTVKAPRRYGFACVNCRKRKVRCDGSRPACHNCRRTQEECSYKKEGSDTQLRLAEARIALLEDKLRMLAVSSNDERERILREHLTEQHEATPPSGNEEEELISQVSIDEDGRVCYFGPTSRFYLAPELRPSEITLNGSSAANSVALSPSPHRQQLQFEEKSDGDWLKSNSSLQKSWERLAFANVQHDNSIDPELSAVLLQVYWTWQHPLHNCVYRPCFTRDMALGGPYFSPFLLNVIYAHASRHANDNDPRFAEVGRGERFLAKAKLLLSAEMEESRPRIPTIQGLLILGGRQCAIGKSSEGWLYTGMAIRMMKDVGLHLNARKLKGLEQLEPDDLEVRKRLFLSAYTWDKTISLCLGRPPSLTEMAHQPSDILDNSDNLEEWRPVCLPDVEHTYPPVQSYTTAAFKQFCRLAEMINEIYSVIYNDKRRVAPCNITRQVLEMERKLQDWHRNLPAHLRIDRVQDLQHCPPPHIFSLNLLYHTILIIVFRPFYWCSPTAHWPPEGTPPTPSSPNSVKLPAVDKHPAQPVQAEQQALFAKAREICVVNTSIIHDFFILYGRTFNFKLMTYLVSYCVYTAATINVHEIKSHDESVSRAAATRLSVSLNVLESEARQTPGVRRSINIIKRQLRSFAMPMGLQTQGQGQGQPQQAQQQYTPTPPPPPPQTATHPFFANHEQMPGGMSGFDPELGIIDPSGGFSAGSLPWNFEDTVNHATAAEDMDGFATDWMPSYRRDPW